MVEEKIQEWEQALNERVAALLAQRVNPLNTELERLEQSLTALRGNFAPGVSEEEKSALAAQVREMLSQAISQTEQRAEARLAEEIEKARAAISTNLRQTLETDFEARLSQTKAEAQTQLTQLQAQLAVAAAAAASSAPSPANASNYPAFKAAVEDIDAQRTQSETLTALIRGAAQFAPRVVFFVVKGGEAVGWKASGFQNGLNDETVRLLSISVQSPGLLSQALNSQTAAIALNPPTAEITAVLGAYNDIAPRGAVAVPLVVRGKAAAVLYADSAGGSDDAIQLEAIETLIHVASMGIELLPTRRNAEPARPAPPTPVPQAVTPVPVAPPPVETPEPAMQPAAPTELPVPSAPAVTFESPSMPFLANPAFASLTEPSAAIPSHQPAALAPESATNEAPALVESFIKTPPPVPEPVVTSSVPAATVPQEEEPVYAAHSYDTNSGLSEEEDEATATTPLPAPEPVPDSVPRPVVSSPGNISLDAPTWMRRLESPSLVSVPEPSAPPPPMQKPSLANWGAKERVPDKEPSIQTETPSMKLADKIPNFNAPSEPPRYAAPSLSVSTAASETEVRAHNDARRFARLLVSEIKLYNAAKVNEGRRNGDLYDRLRDEIDRSRKVYDKRVSPTVAAKFDYFYDELVQTLAEGDPSKLGESCPGPFVVAS